MSLHNTIVTLYNIFGITLIVCLCYGFVLFVKIAKRLIKALDIYLEEKGRRD